jgi:hypothetical protein
MSWSFPVALIAVFMTVSDASDGFGGLGQAKRAYQVGLFGLGRFVFKPTHLGEAA